MVETQSWETVLAAPVAHRGVTQGLAFSIDGSRVMSTGTDGLVKIWDLGTAVEVDRLRVDDVSDGYWLDDAHIVVATGSGLWTTLSLDTGELLELARTRLTRHFAPEECAIYRIEPCS